MISFATEEEASDFSRGYACAAAGKALPEGSSLAFRLGYQKAREDLFGD